MARFKTLEEFVRDYEKRGVIDKVGALYRPSKALNDKQVHRYYEQYVRKWQRANDANSAHEQSADSKLSQYVRERDGRCRLLSILTVEEYSEWRQHEGGAGRILDAAHVFGKGEVSR